MKKGDAAIIFVFAVICAAWFFKSFFAPPQKLVACVWQNGSLVSQVELSNLKKTKTMSVGGCELEFDESGARFVSSTCKDGLCVKKGKLSNSGDTMACVPNGVVITIKAQKENADAVAY